ncbi:MAG: hypothetical protein ACM3U2_03915 [Deltaproteobacteria bacterium]
MPRIRAIVLFVLVTGAMVGFSQPASAQVQPFVGFGVGFGPGWGYGGYGYGFGGGTVESNYLYGMSNVIRAEGEYNALTSAAGVNYEEARGRYLDNQKKWWQNYLEGQEAHQKLMVAKRAREKHSPEALALAAASGLPRPLPPDALDPVTGQITWPEVLQADKYAGDRKELEQLFELRAKTTQTAGTSEAVHAAADKMTGRLRKDVQSLPANEYMVARKFLDSLAWAAR